MKVSGLKVLAELETSLKDGTVESVFPVGSAGTHHAFKIGLSETGLPKGASGFPGITPLGLFKVIDRWPMKHLYEFIKSLEVRHQRAIFDVLIPMIDSTESLGADAVIQLVTMDVELSKKFRVPVREEMVAHLIGSYGGRISVISGLSSLLKDNFPDSALIDQALEKHVAVHKLGDQSFNAVARSSDLLTCVAGYSRTLRAHLQCLYHARSEHIDRYFIDSASHGLSLYVLNAYIDVVGYGRALELGGEALSRNCRANMQGAGATFRVLVNRLPFAELIRTSAMADTLSAGGGPSRMPDFYQWYLANMPLVVPELIEHLIPKIKDSLAHDGVFPCRQFISSWQSLREEHVFLSDYLECLSVEPKARVLSLSAGRELKSLHELASKENEEGLEDYRARLVDAAFSDSMSLNGLASSIRNAVLSVQPETLGIVLPKLSRCTLDALVRSYDHTRRNQLMKTHAGSRGIVFSTDLGL